MTGKRPSPDSGGAVIRTTARHRSGGFTLVELAIVLIVLGVLAGALLAPFGERLERRRHDETARRLDDVRRALVGHLVTQGVLPCPLIGETVYSGGRADRTDAGPASFVTCRHGYGYVPSAALGVAGPVDTEGALLDGWGRRLHYGVSLASDGRRGEPALPDWLVPGEAQAVGAGRLAADLSLCRTASDGACPRRASRADALVFVVVSTGADATPGGLGRENVDGDRVYVLAPPSIVPGDAFDDLLVWGARDELAWWLLRSGWLP